MSPVNAEHGPETIARLQRVANAQFDGDLKWTLSEIIDGALAELWAGGDH
jgi:hypothetical protein